MSSKSFIYTLHELGNGVVRYVGRTSDPVGRMKAHIQSPSVNGSDKEKWVIDTYEAGGEIAMDVVEECDIELSPEREQFWIDYHVTQGIPLVNTIMKVVPSEQWYAKDDIRLSFRLSGADKDAWEKLRNENRGRTDKDILRLLLGNHTKVDSLDDAMLREIHTQVSGASHKELRSDLDNIKAILEMICEKLSEKLNVEVQP